MAFASKIASKNPAKPGNSPLLFKDGTNDAFIQPKLKIGQPNDKFEVEADAIADNIVSDIKNNVPTPIIQPQFFRGNEESLQKQGSDLSRGRKLEAA